MKKSNGLIKWLLVFVIVLGVAMLTGASAELGSGTCGDNLTWTLTDNGILTISGTGDMNDYTYVDAPWGRSIKKVTLEYGVTGIGEAAFFYCTNLRDVTIPDSVTEIRLSAFEGCTSLKTVFIPSGVKLIYSAVFADCPSLTGIDVDQNNRFYSSVDGILYNKSHTTIVAYPAGKEGDSYTIPEGVNKIWDLCFSCSKLKTIELPSSINEIGSQVFQGCTDLTGITIPYGTTYVSWGAFLDCTSLANIVIPGSATEIMDYAFANCTGMKSISIPQSVTNIKEYAFFNCGSLTDVYYRGTKDQWNNITIESGNEALASATIHYANGFCGATMTWTLTDNGILTISGTGDMNDYTYVDAPWGRSIKKVTLEYGVTGIGEAAFFYCTNLRDVTIPDSVTEIRFSAFEGCTNLETIFIPQSVKSVYSAAFADCTSLTGIEVDERNRQYSSIDGVLYYKSGTTIVAYPAGKEGDFYTIPEGVNKIWDACFSCSKLKAIELPSSIREFGSSVFYGCTGLTNITIPYGTTYVSWGAFSDCTSLTNIVIPGSVTMIMDYAFANCTGMKSISIPQSVTNIKEYAFFNCGSLTDVYYGGTEEQWKAITIERNNTCLNDAKIHYGFYKNERTLILPGSLTSIESDAFVGINSEAVLIPNTVTSIVGNPFSGSEVEIIYGTAGSVAESFANSYGYTFVSVN